MVVNRGLAWSCRGREHQAIVSRAVVRRSSRESWSRDNRDRAVVVTFLAGGTRGEIVRGWIDRGWMDRGWIDLSHSLSHSLTHGHSHSHTPIHEGIHTGGRREVPPPLCGGGAKRRLLHGWVCGCG